MAASLDKLSLGFSPCPNDTFIFYSLVHGLTATKMYFDKEVLADVETLNQWAMDARLDVTKLSFHALGHVLDDYALLSAGSALGRGCGPLLVARAGNKSMELGDKIIALPGKFTTAALLLRLFLPDCEKLVSMRFDEIMPAIVSGQVDAGVIIHESRFTYQDFGLIQIQDLGAWWEGETGLPIPLGGIAAKKSLGQKTLHRINVSIRESLESSHRAPKSAQSYIRRHAQELDEQVISQHIQLYVNQFSMDLGLEGRDAVDAFISRGRKSGVLPDTGELNIID